MSYSPHGATYLCIATRQSRKIEAIDNLYSCTTKIDGLLCPPNISETVAVRIMKLAHRPRIASATVKLISTSSLLSFQSILLKTIQPINAGPKANQGCGAETAPPFFSVIRPTPFATFRFVDNLVLPSGRSICIMLFSLLIPVVLTYSYGELNCNGLYILITFIYIVTRRLT